MTKCNHPVSQVEAVNGELVNPDSVTVFTCLVCDAVRAGVGYAYAPGSDWRGADVVAKTDTER